MFTEVQIENYKSIQSLKINLGRVNVFIGENGCGKSNILEAIALAGAAAGDKLDNEFLAPRGIRVTEPEFMRSAFDKENTTKEIEISLKFTAQNGQELLKYKIQNDNNPYSKWIKVDRLNKGELLIKDFEEANNEEEQISFVIQLMELFNNGYKTHLLEANKFVIYSPENYLLRTFEEEGQVQPLGIKGQGLLKLLRVLSSSSDKINEIKQRLELMDWFDDFKIHQDSDIERTIQIKDRYLDKELPYFNQRSSNEGFLFLMFYFALFVSDDTPSFFAIDNIENALNPKLCTKLIQELVELAKKYDKQVIFTTHNPAILDGLDLNDDEQRLFVIYRNMDGHTKARQISPLEPLDDDEIVPLSEAFINGYIGGLPKTFNMYTFGAIVEGITDFPIINSILIGYFNDSKIDINPISPINFKASSNYDKVFKSCKPEKLKRAFLANKYIIIHFDTDVSENYFGISPYENDKPLSPQQLIDKVVDKFKQQMGEEFYSQYGHRIIFAIAVHSIECWLFPLLASDDKSAETENCCEVLEKTVLGFRKKYEHYQEITERYRSHDDLLNLYPKNPSLKIFIEELASKNIEISEES